MAKPKVAASWCVHDDTSFLALSINSFSSVPSKVVFVSRTAWHGDVGNWEAAADLAKANGCEVVIGDWPDESLHRRAALTEMKARGCDFLFIPDGDEVIQERLLNHLLKLASVNIVDALRCHMDTFWKGPNYIIRPREELAPLILLRVAQAEHIHIREYESGPRLMTLSPDFGILLHLSYAGSDQRIARKISSWGHRTEVVNNWFERIWKGWDTQRSMRDLHPTHPHCYGFAERVPLPAELCSAPDPRPLLGDPPLPKRWPRLSIVIPLHGGEGIIANCLDSLVKLDDLLHEIIIVDDVSPDRAMDVVQTYPTVTALKNERNLGFGATCNRGFSASTGDVIIFLNSDTIVPRAGLIRLIESLYASGTVGAVGPMSNSSGYHQGTSVTYTSLQNLEFFAQDYAHRQATDLDVNMLVGFCLAVRKEALDEVGAFDEQFGIGMFEDNDLCYRLIRAGYKLKVASRSFVHHEGSKTLMAREEHPIQLLTRNRQLFQEKWKQDIDLGFSSHLSGMGVGRIVFNFERHPERVAQELLVKADAADISLCMIVKNEERVVRECLISARPFFKQMIVVDTGSTDRTMEIAQELGAEVYHFPWTDSFSDARNESLRHARGKWCFWMDADDTLPHACGEHLLDLALSTPGEVIGVVVPVRFIEEGPGGTQVDHVKLFRNHPGVKFEFRIHEQTLASLHQIGGEIIRSNAYVLHSGYDISEEGQARKRERDYKLLRLDLDEQGEHPFILFNCGMTDHFTARHRTAVDWLERSIVASNGQGSHLRKAYALLAGSLRELGRPEEALQTVFAGLQAVGEDPELRFQAGILLANAGRFEEAKEQYLSISSDTGTHFSSVNLGIFGALRDYNLGVVCHGLRDYSGARDYWLRALGHRPMHRESLDALWASAMAISDYSTLQAVLEIIRNTDGERDLWATFGMTYAAALEGAVGPERFLAQAVQRNPQGSEVRTHLVRLLLAQDRIQEAIPHLFTLVDNGVAEGAFCLGVIHIRAGDFKRALTFMEQAQNLDSSHKETNRQVDTLRTLLTQERQTG